MSALAKLKKLQNKFMGTEKVERLSTGILGLDLLLHGGFPLGGIHELYGYSKTGKTLLILLTIKSFLDSYKNAVAVVFDGENAYKNLDRVASLGIDLDRLIIVPKKKTPTVSDCYEKMKELVLEIELMYREENKKSSEDEEVSIDKSKIVEGLGRKLVKASPYIFIAIDSLASYPESLDLVEDQGRRAKMWHAVFRRLTGIIDNRVVVLASNHIVHKPSFYGDGQFKTGGVASDFYRDDGVKLMNIGHLKSKGKVIGYWIEAEVEKTRDGAIHGKTFFPVFFRKTPVSYYSGVLPLAYYLGLIEITNKTAWSKRNKVDNIVWPKFKYKKKEITEKNLIELEKFLKETGLVEEIKSKLQEIC